MISFVVPGRPCAKQSVRFTRAGHRYQPQDVIEYRSRIAVFAREANDQGPLTGPVGITLAAYFLIPASWSKRKKSEARFHISKPDADNLIKAFLDGIQGILISNDSQVAAVEIQKLWSHESDRLEVTIYPLLQGRALEVGAGCDSLAAD